MKRILSFFKTTLLGGMAVMLPAVIIAAAFAWLFRLIRGALAPVSGYLGALLPELPRLGGVVVDATSVALVLASCFFLGLLVRTRAGDFLFRRMEQYVLGRVPGYRLVKETVNQFVGENRTPFAGVALARVFGNAARMTAFVTDRHADGSYTVFVPTAPNPTSGNIFHLPAEAVELIDTPVETAMRSILACGSGSRQLLGGAPVAPGASTGSDNSKDEARPSSP